MKRQRQGIDNITRVQICEFVRSQKSPPSTKLIRDWAESTFNRSFPQSTISTLLRNNGLQIKRAGGRGRRCIKNTPLTTTSYNSDQQVQSVRTNVLVGQLKLLADGRCRGRSSEYPEIELLVLEETYLMLKYQQYQAKPDISIAWFHQIARHLFKKHNNGKIPKHISQFLNQILDKYYLLNTVFQYLCYHVSYQVMMAKLIQVYPDLCSFTSDFNSPATPPPPEIPENLFNFPDFYFDYSSASDDIDSCSQQIPLVQHEQWDSIVNLDQPLPTEPFELPAASIATLDELPTLFPEPFDYTKESANLDLDDYYFLDNLFKL